MGDTPRLESFAFCVVLRCLVEKSSFLILCAKSYFELHLGKFTNHAHKFKRKINLHGKEGARQCRDSRKGESKGTGSRGGASRGSSRRTGAHSSSRSASSRCGGGGWNGFCRRDQDVINNVNNTWYTND